MRDRDPEGYYAALNVSPGASTEEIRLSYEFLKRAHRSGNRVSDIARIVDAYETLTNRRLRAQYDSGKSPKASGPSVGETLANLKPLIGSTVTLGITVAVLVGIVAVMFAPGWMAELRSFAPGDELIWKNTGKPIGRVLAFETGHEFSAGIRADGYRIQPEQGGPVWIPAGDLKRHGTKK